MVFTGRFDHVLDDKGRIALPAAMRAQIRPEIHGEGFYLVQGNRYLQLVPEKLFEHLASSVKAALLPDAKVAKASRFFFSNVFKLDPDKQGRVMIPDGFLKSSKNPDTLVRTLLNTEVTLVGNGDRIEVWNRATFLAHMTETSDDVDTIKDDLKKLFGAPQEIPQFHSTAAPRSVPTAAASVPAASESTEPNN